MKRLLVTCTLLCCAASLPAHAGAWLQPKGKGLFIQQASYFTNDEFYNRSGDKQPQPRYTKYEYQPYVECGLLDRLTIGGSAYMQQVSQSSISNNGIADPELFVRTTLWRGEGELLSLQPLVKFKSHFDKDTPPRGGSRSTDGELSLLYGRNLNLFSPRDYLDARVGYRWRGNALNNQLKADLALGLEVAPHWQVIPALRTVTSAEIRKGAAFAENGDLDYNLTKAELGVQYSLSATQSIGAAVYDHVDGKQTGTGTGITLSYAQRF